MAEDKNGAAQVAPFIYSGKPVIWYGIALLVGENLLPSRLWPKADAHPDFQRKRGRRKSNVQDIR